MQVAARDRPLQGFLRIADRGGQLGAVDTCYLSIGHNTPRQLLGPVRLAMFVTKNVTIVTYLLHFLDLT